MIKKLLILPPLLLSVLACSGQQTTSAAGSDAVGNGGSVSYSIGQIDYSQSAGNGFVFSEGVQQPFEIFITGVEDVLEAIGVHVFPNPAKDEIQAESTEERFGYRLYDASGKLLQTAPAISKIHRIGLQSYSAGTYYLYPIQSNKPLPTITIIKR